MTSARSQPFCRKYNINKGRFEGKEITPRNITERKRSFFIHNNHFCSIWKSQNIIFNKAEEDELKTNFKDFDSVLSKKHGKSFNKYEYKPKKVQHPLTNIVVHDVETFNKIRAVPYCSCIYKISKTSGKHNRDMSVQESRKYLNDCVNFKGTDSNNEMLGQVLSFKEAIKVNN